MNQLGAEVLTVLRATMTADTFDNSQYEDWTNPKKMVIRGCSVQPFILSEKYTAEYEVERKQARQMLRVWVPSGQNILYTDRILWKGTEYEVMGIQSVWNHLDGTENHSSLLMRERVG